MAHGGRRVGAGRKIGSATKRTREIADKAAAEGITPLEVMLANMRWAFDRVEAIRKKHEGEPEVASVVESMMGFRALAQTAAKDAAPYMHPKLANLEHSGPEGAPIPVQFVEFRAVYPKLNDAKG